MISVSLTDMHRRALNRKQNAADEAKIASRYKTPAQRLAETKSKAGAK